jgi:hypothetical protein
MIEPKELVERKICISFAEARRMIMMLPEEEILLKMRENVKWGRKPNKVAKIVWPKEKDSPVLENVVHVYG